MNNNTVQNQEKEIPKTINMNDRDYVNDVLSTEKCFSNNLSTALSEASNEDLFNELLTMFSETKAAARDLFNLLFTNGWYKLEKAEDTKIQQKQNDMSTKLNELNSQQL